MGSEELDHLDLVHLISGCITEQSHADSCGLHGVSGDKICTL